MTARVEGILLAAGESRRMGYPKPLLKIGGQTFIAHLSRLMLDVLPRLVVVLGDRARLVRPAIPGDPRITVVENPNYQKGQLSSLKLGLGELGAQAEAAMVHLGDHPLVRPATLAAMLAEYERRRPAILIARYAGRRGHPAIFARSVFAELLDAPPGEGARAVVNRNAARVVYLEVDDPGVTLDLDTPADLERAGLPPPPHC